ncbi:MAG: polyprenyl synthetase family protein, partial [Planctomycetes bacterium]|nr:polyprenyl synthetase family protein [Planctomycetota bacterium]
DIDVVWDAIYANTPDTGWRLNLGDLRSQVDQWFTVDSLRDVLGFDANTTREVEQLALKWLSKAGKRWRPFLAAGVYQAIAKDSCESLRKVAVAVECFHKASLIHDDIEDDDDYRYGEKTLNAEYGVPIALNVGDFLLGEGYRLLAECDVADRCKAKMLRIAAEGHRNLCLGQGEELAWMRRAGPLSSEQVLDIFSRKTSPAFEVALKLGATLAGADKLDAAIEQYSKALGVAYQIRDDIDDFNSPSAKDNALALRPSLLLALACRDASGSDKQVLESIWNRPEQSGTASPEIRKIMERLDVERQATEMLELRKLEAIGALNLLDNSSLKSFLRKIICKIFDDIEIMGHCNDTKRADARSGESG